MALLVLSLSLSLHDDCVISFFLSNTHIHIYNSLSSNSFSSLFISITRSNHPYLIHSFPLTLVLSNSHIHSPIPTSQLFLLSKKNQTMHPPHFHRLAAPILLLLLQLQLHPLFTTASSSPIDHTHDSDKTLFHFVTVSKKKKPLPRHTKTKTAKSPKQSLTSPPSLASRPQSPPLEHPNPPLF